MEAFQITKACANDSLGPTGRVTDSRGLGQHREGERSVPGEGDHISSSA